MVSVSDISLKIVATIAYLALGSNSGMIYVSWESFYRHFLPPYIVALQLETVLISPFDKHRHKLGQFSSYLKAS